MGCSLQQFLTVREDLDAFHKCIRLDLDRVTTTVTLGVR